MDRHLPARRQQAHPTFTRAVLAGALILTVGCSSNAKVELYQPRADGQQQLVRLESEWADFAVGNDGKDRLLLAFPLPGSRTGTKQYLIYLRHPAGGGSFGAGPDATAAGAVQGFLIQESGRLAGRTDLARGRITVSGGKNQRTGDLLVKFKDGTEVQGTFSARRSDLSVEFFEDEHLADLTALGDDPKQADPADDL